MIRCLNILFGFCFIFAQLSTAHAQMGQGSQPPQRPSKKKKAVILRDPAVSRLQPIETLSLSEKEALKRSGRSGVLQAEEALLNKIYEIIISGAKKVEPEAVLVLLKSQLNKELSKQNIQNDIRQIYKIGLFTNIEAHTESGPNQSLVLIYKLEEKSTISQIKFKGNKDISIEDLKDATDLRAYQVADMHRIRENAEKIRRVYIDKGFMLAQVSYEIKHTRAHESDFVDVIFHIDEETKAEVKQISILGNHALSTDFIKKNIRTKEKHPISFITQWGLYNEEMLEIDALIIEQLYQERGFLNVQVDKPRANLSPDKTRIDIFISITEGESYKLGSVAVSGDLLGHSDKSLTKKVTLKSGDAFNKPKLGQNIQAIQEVFQDDGYAYVNISPETHINEENKVVDLNLVIDPGPKVNFGRFDIKGNATTIDDVIRRELRVYEGEQYSSSLLRLSEQRLNQLGYFESVKFITKPTDNPEIIDIEIEVKEKRLGQIQVGGGYGTGGEGFLLQAQVSQNNLFGRGQSLSGTVMWSGFRRIFELQFIDPYITYISDYPLSFSIRVYDTQRFFMDYYRASSGGEVSFGYPIGAFLSPISNQWYKNASPSFEPYVPDFENLRFFLSFMAERVKIEDSLEGINYWGWHLNEPRYTTSLKPTLQFDQRNNRLMATAGWFLEFKTEFATSYLGSVLLADLENEINKDSKKSNGIEHGLSFLKQDAKPNNFIRYGATWRSYYNFDRWFFLKNWVLKLNLDFGMIDTFGLQLISENYRLGGVQLGSPTGLRGYFFQSVGPSLTVGQQFSTQPTKNLVVGGNKQILANLELEFPIARALGLFGVAFFDMGNVYAPGEGFFYIGNKDINTLYPRVWDPLGFFYGLGLFSSVGFGVRWFSPMGVLRFEWGFPLVRRPHGTPGIPGGDGSMQFIFTIGQSF